jgi:hypothetical protein
MASIDLKITFTTPVHIGDGSADGTVARDTRGRPCIRAATLKGLHRAATEQIAAGLGFAICNAPARLCHPLPGQPACPVCRIFGSPWLAGVVYYRDLVAEQTPTMEAASVAPQSRHRRVKIGLYTRKREVLPAGLALAGRIDHLINEPPLLALALIGLRSIRAVGAGNATGHGLCMVEARALDSFKRPADEAELADSLRRFQQGKP